MYSSKVALSDNQLISLGVLIALGCFVLDMITPHTILISPAYILAIIVTLYSSHRRALFIVSGVVLCLLVASLLIALFTSSVVESIINYAISLGTIFLSFSIILYVFNIRQLHSNETRQMGSMFDNANEGIILTNGKGEVIIVNPQAAALFGYYPSELIGQKIEILIPDNFRGNHSAHRDKYYQAPSNRSMGVGRDLFGKKKDGSVFPVEISLSYYKSEKESYVIAFIIDITIRKQSEQKMIEQRSELIKISDEVKQLNSSLERKVEDRTTMLRETLAQLEKSKEEITYAFEKEKELGDLKSRFVSTVSHEFRTPLAAILSSAALIGKYTTTEDDPKRMRHINRIHDSVRHLSAMLEDLLSLGKLEEGLIEVRSEELNLPAFMEEFTAHQQEISKPGMYVKYIHTGEQGVNIDKKLLTNILINLVGNAIKFSPENGEVTITSAIQNNLLTISVADNGIGISEEDKQHLFERFFRARNATNIPGTGLGLHILSKYLELMNGKINLESELNKGSKFTVTIPL